MRCGLIVGDLAGRCRDGGTAALADQQCVDDTGIRRVGRGQFEDDALPLLFRRRRRRQRVEEGLLLRTAEGRKPVERREGRRRKMGAAGEAATAAVVEHHAPAELGGGDTNGVGACAVLHSARDRTPLKLHIHATGQPQGAAARQGSRVEDAAEILGGVRRRHGCLMASGGWREPESVCAAGGRRDA